MYSFIALLGIFNLFFIYISARKYLAGHMEKFCTLNIADRHLMLRSIVLRMFQVQILLSFSFILFFSVHFSVIVRKVKFEFLFAIFHQFSCQSVTRMSRCFFIVVTSVVNFRLLMFAPSLGSPYGFLFMETHSDEFGGIVFFFSVHFSVIVRKVEFVILFAIFHQFSCQSITRMSHCFFIVITSVVNF